MVGIVLAAVGFTGILNKTPSDMESDYNSDEGDYESYDKGDTVTVTGEITNESETNFFGETMYTYEMGDTDWGFVSGEDLGDEGDTITVTLECKEESVMGSSVEYMEAKSVQTIPLMGILGIVIAIAGGIIAAVGFIKGNGEEDQEPYQEEPYQQGPAQQSQQPGQQQSQQPGQQQSTQSAAAAPTQQQTQESENACEVCGEELRYIDEYDRWYCDNCQEYK
ncbi:MAG: hypothetical protein KGY76_04365 [Candidatus Thermoplasmatota archaeon]|nr:hypothetical protein [Candidatus Thermoplasmatota archaeon]